MKKDKQSKEEIEVFVEKSELGYFETQQAIHFIKTFFSSKLAEKLSLIKVEGPLFIKNDSGLQDDLAQTQKPVSFRIRELGEEVEIVHSLAKWKRFMLGKYDFEVYHGLYTNMLAIRKDESLSPLHSVLVDQWDWEMVIDREDRKLSFLKSVVNLIYECIKETEEELVKLYPKLIPQLPPQITFVHSEELEQMYPELTPRQREDEIAKKFKSVFVIGIGYPLKSGKPHDIRATDYDDWSTSTYDESAMDTHGLNGDIIVWSDVLQRSIELSSMGIRVDAKSLLRQLELRNELWKKGLKFHKMILKDELPLSIGGGIGQSRLCMFLLQKTHIKEVQESVWPDD